MNKGRDLKPHIGIFGRRNNGKSSFINAITGQDVAIVSDVAGTTTDPVKKSVEIFGIGPAIMIDTAGIDDSGDLGQKRVKKSLEIIRQVDCGVLLITGNEFDRYEKEVIARLKSVDVPFIIAHNKSDAEKMTTETIEKIRAVSDAPVVDFSAVTKSNLDTIIDELKRTIPQTAYQKPSLFEGLLKPKDVVLLITPIDSEAPDGRMILPQVMAWRDALDHDAICMSVKETELKDFFKLNIRPALAVTDSQAFEYVSSVVPADVPLTGFSILFARIKGPFEKYIHGTRFISKLKDGDKVLILESCTHQVSCEDIGRHKLPKWINQHTGKNIAFEIIAGNSFLPENISSYSLVIQCGGCMSTRKQIMNRLKPFTDTGIPVTNYGMTIAFLKGIFERAMKPFHSSTASL